MSSVSVSAFWDLANAMARVDSSSQSEGSVSQLLLMSIPISWHILVT